MDVWPTVCVTDLCTQQLAFPLRLAPSLVSGQLGLTLGLGSGLQLSRLGLSLVLHCEHIYRAMLLQTAIKPVTLLMSCQHFWGTKTPSICSDAQMRLRCTATRTACEAYLEHLNECSLDVSWRH